MISCALLGTRALFLCPGRDWLSGIHLQPGSAPHTTPRGAIQPCHWHPLEPNKQQEAPICLGNRDACLGKGPWAISLGAGRERTFTGFLPSGGPQTSDWMLRTDLPFPSACRTWARGEMGTASAGPCPRQPASTGSRGRWAGRGWEAVRHGGLVSVK